MSGLLGVARGWTARARLHHDRGRRHACRDSRSTGISAIMTRVAIVGAGPAGIAAANVLVAHGVAPAVTDEGLRPGGQIYRQPRPGLRLDIEALLGAEAKNYR